MAESGLAEELGQLLVPRLRIISATSGFSPPCSIATMLLTELLSNNAAAVLMFPIAMAAASRRRARDARPFAMAILIGASCSFLTPIGYQTNLLVYGMGGYRFLDFTRFGVPLDAPDDRGLADRDPCRVPAERIGDDRAAGRGGGVLRAAPGRVARR